MIGIEIVRIKGLIVIDCVQTIVCIMERWRLHSSMQ